MVSLTTPGDQVLVGTSTNAYDVTGIGSTNLTIQATSTIGLPLAIRKFPGQTTDLLRIVDEDVSDPITFLSVSASGVLAISEAGTATTTIRGALATSTFAGGGSFTTGGLSTSGGFTLTGGLFRSTEELVVSSSATSTFTGGIYANDLRTNLPSCDSLDTDASGAIICGTDSTGSATFPFTPNTWGNSTSTTLGFLNGFISSASSSISGADLSIIGGKLGVGTTSPYADISIKGSASNRPLFALRPSNTLASTTPAFVLLHSDGTSAIEMRTGGIGQFNTFVGVGVGTSTVTGGLKNTALGYQAFQSNTTADFNTAVGYQALFKNSTGSGNSAFGSSALFANTTGANNSAFGSSALNVNTTGSSNSVFGSSALSANTTGGGNSAFGDIALVSNTTGAKNSAFGSNALDSNTTGSSNTAFGYFAGSSVLNGGGNVFLGYQAGDNITSASSSIIIGYDINAPSATANNQLNIGNLIFGTSLDGTGSTISSGFIGIGTTTPAQRLSVNGRSFFDSAEIRYASSSAQRLTFNYQTSATSTVANNVKNVWSIGTTTTVTPIFSIDAKQRNLDLARIGIGTSSPAANLHINGSMYLLGGSGDANNSGALAAGDATSIASYVGTGGYLDMEGYAAADINGDGRVNLLDSDIVATVVAGTISLKDAHIKYKHQADALIYPRLDKSLEINASVLTMGTSSSRRLNINYNSPATSTILASEHNSWTIGTSTGGQPIFRIDTKDSKATTSINGGFQVERDFFFMPNGRLGIGTTSPAAQLSIDKFSGLSSSTPNVLGIDEQLKVGLSGDGTMYGNRMYIVNAPTGHSNTLVGQIIRVQDSTTLANTVRGLEVQAHQGTNTLGENTGVSAFGRTFGVKGITTGDAGATFIPAGVYGETRGTTQGNAIRAFSNTITTAQLADLYQDTSTFSGTALRATMAAGSGTFTGKFVSLLNNSKEVWKIGSTGSTTVGTSTQYWSLTVQGGVCITSGTKCPTAEVNGGLRVDTAGVAAGDDPGDVFDVAERYPASEAMEAGDIVMIDTSTSTKALVTKALASTSTPPSLIGIVSTRPALAINGSDIVLAPGFDATSTKPLVALVGRVPVKISMENGEIKKGDRVTASSILGVGRRAKDGEATVGFALEDYSTTTADAIGKVLVFVNLGHATLDPEIVAGTTNTASSTLDQMSGAYKPVEGSMDLAQKDIYNIRGILSANGTWQIDQDGHLKLASIEAESVKTQKLEVGSSDKPFGATLYDTQGGTPYCVYISGGQLQTVSGTCDVNASAIFGGQTPTPTPSSDETPTVPPSSETSGTSSAGIENTVPASETPSSTEPTDTMPTSDTTVSTPPDTATPDPAPSVSDPPAPAPEPEASTPASSSTSGTDAATTETPPPVPEITPTPLSVIETAPILQPETSPTPSEQ